MAYNFWIGLTYETQVQKSTPWVWSNGDMSNVTQWDTGEPNNLVGEHCTHIIKKTERWNNRVCNTDLAWICEKTKSSNTTAKATGIYIAKSSLYSFFSFYGEISDLSK